MKRTEYRENLFLSFQKIIYLTVYLLLQDSDFFVVYRGTGEEVIDESDKAKAWDGEKKQDDDVALERKDEADDWTLVVSILCLMVVVIVGLALFAVFLMRRWNRQY